MLERQAEGFEVAKAAGRIKGRPSTAQKKAPEVKKLATTGVPGSRLPISFVLVSPVSIGFSRLKREVSSF